MEIVYESCIIDWKDGTRNLKKLSKLIFDRIIITNWKKWIFYVEYNIVKTLQNIKRINMFKIYFIYLFV